MSAAREEVLRHVRDALAGAVRPAPVVRAYRTSGTRSAAERIALLCERVASYGAEVHCIASADVAATAARAIGCGPVGIPPGLPLEWRPAGVELVEDDGLATSELEALSGALTGCTLAIAETGTLVLASGPADGSRALTLVPDLHVCVVRRGHVVETVPQAFASLGTPSQPLTFVSGPSATSDIELSRVEGVHGPRRLVVIVSDV